MTTAFIVRPFGEQTTRMNKKPIKIDFDRVERELIDPVLNKLGITGRTTGEIVAAGNIRDDMFRLLLTRDLVVADVTIHNANVFYELGIRHALRDRKTFLIRGKGDPMPFDNLTDRYFEYDLKNPGAKVEELAKAIKRTIDSEASDSPVFRSIPNLEAPDVNVFVTVPSDFGGEVEIAKELRRPGDLLLLAFEAKGFDWEVAGLRSVGNALFDMNALEAACMTWERVRAWLPRDREANQRLGTIYQKLAQLAKSDKQKIRYWTQSNQALERALKLPALPIEARAENYALMASNEKARWSEEWGAQTQRKRQAALGSPLLRSSYEFYEQGFHVDLNQFYPGLNALAMLTILTSLAEDLPQQWSELFTSEQDAKHELDGLKTRRSNLIGAVRLSLECERNRLAAQKKSDIWFEISWADFHCLTVERRPQAVAALYRDAMAKLKKFPRDSAAKQLLIYQDLGLMLENVKAALAVIKPPGAAGTASTPPHTLLFTGHRIDDPDRKKPRFPVAKEAQARKAIADAVDAELAAATAAGRTVIGIAGGASGGDILFHEVCFERKITTEMYLAMPRKEFVEASVRKAGPDWIKRFDKLAAQLETHILGTSNELPVWLRQKEKYSIWDRSNHWMLENSLVNGGQNATVIALWNGKPGDGSGGTQHMVKEADDCGARVVRLDTAKVFAKR